jgi:hypothetical protein
VRETDRWGMDLGFRLAPVQSGARPRFPAYSETTPRAGVRVYQVAAS